MSNSPAPYALTVERYQEACAQLAQGGEEPTELALLALLCCPPGAIDQVRAQLASGEAPALSHDLQRRSSRAHALTPERYQEAYAQLVQGGKEPTELALLAQLCCPPGELERVRAQLAER